MLFLNHMIMLMTLIDINALENVIINAIVLPKNMYLNVILSNNLNIAYNITELTKDYVYH